MMDVYEDSSLNFAAHQEIMQPEKTESTCAQVERQMYLFYCVL